jgi:hypothetical protein
MAVKKNSFDPLKARKELLILIDNFITVSKSGELREKVKALIPAFHLIRKFGTNIISKDQKKSARNRILIYLQKYPLTIIDSEELLIVSGITDYQRRIRELRVQFGWPILSGKTAKAMNVEGEWDSSFVDVSDMKAYQYIMLTTGQDRDAAHRWNVINTIRKEKLSVKDKIIKYFLANIGRRVNGEELSYLANEATEWGRRVRELRTEEGWSIKTRNTGRPDLPVGIYVLEAARQAEVHDRKIDDAVRVEVLERDNFSCRKCGWKDSQKKEGDPRQLLELHHLNYHADKGSNTLDNLITVCNVDHVVIHKKRLNKSDVLRWMKIKNL